MAETAGKKYSVILGNLGNTRDRFCSGGYKETPDTMTMLKSAAAIEGVTGVELVGTWDIRPDNVGDMSSALGDLGLSCVSVIPDHFCQPVWGRGAFVSRDAAVRRKAVDFTTVPTLEFERLFNRVYAFGEEEARYAYRGEHPDFDAEGLRTGEWSALWKAPKPPEPPKPPPEPKEEQEAPRRRRRGGAIPGLV